MSAPASYYAAQATNHLILTRTGQTTLTRPASQADHDAVNRMHARSSLESRFSRYQAARRMLRPAEWSHLVRPSHGSSWVTHPAGNPHLIVAATHLMRTDNDHVGELALLVEDAWQNVGLGMGLTRYALAHAASLGMHAVTVRTSRANSRMLSICRTLGARTPRTNGTAVDLSLPLA